VGRQGCAASLDPLFKGAHPLKIPFMVPKDQGERKALVAPEGVKFLFPRINW